MAVAASDCKLLKFLDLLDKREIPFRKRVAAIMVSSLFDRENLAPNM